MARFPYTQNATNLTKFFSEIQKIGQPTNVTNQWLESIGFKSSNDRSIASILKFIGFTDNASAPTEAWQAYRNKKHAGAVMAERIRQAYPTLFETYPDAYRKDDEALHNFFITHSKLGKKAVTLMVRTFKTLSELASFDSANSETETPESVSRPTDFSQPKETSQSVELSPSKGVTINVNIQLQLPATDDAAIYDKLFEALKKHILS